MECEFYLYYMFYQRIQRIEILSKYTYYLQLGYISLNDKDKLTRLKIFDSPLESDISYFAEAGAFEVKAEPTVPSSESSSLSRLIVCGPAAALNRNPRTVRRAFHTEMNIV